MICYISAQQSYISIIKLINGEIHLRLRARGSALHHTITATGTLLISICISFTRHILLNFFMQSMTTKKLVILHHLNFLRLELFDLQRTADIIEHGISFLGSYLKA